MTKIIRKYMAIGARVKVIRTNPFLLARVGDEGAVYDDASGCRGRVWAVQFDDGHKEFVAAAWAEVLESPNTHEYDLTPLPSSLPRPQPLNPHRTYCLDTALPELRDWLRDIEEGRWPERAYRFWAEDATRDNRKSLANRVPASDRIVASHQVSVLRRIIGETEFIVALRPWDEPQHW